MTFDAKIRQRPANRCDCWDCLRAEGLTPPLGLRARHRSPYFPKDKEMRGLGIDTDGRTK